MINIKVITTRVTQRVIKAVLFIDEYLSLVALLKSSKITVACIKVCS